MITTTKKKEIKSNLVKPTRTFQIKATGKAFRTLIDGLYQNKIAAMVREIMSNAYDAHIEAGKPKVPFDVYIPNVFNPTFYVRDYGPGMDHDMVMELYTTIFHSSKEETNEQVGMFGLGSKSPFAYTDSFSVETYQGGLRQSYLCHVNDEDLPTITHLGCEKNCGEPDGVKIEVAVAVADVEKFRAEFQKYAMAYAVKPNTLNAAFPVPHLADKIHNFSFYSNIDAPFLTDSCYLNQGSVLYPLKYDTTTADIFKSTPAFINFFRTGTYNKVIIDAPIGTFNVTPSREAISYDKDSVVSLQAFCLASMKGLTQEVTQRLEDPTLNRYQRYLRYMTLSPVLGGQQVNRQTPNKYNLKMTTAQLSLPPDHLRSNWTNSTSVQMSSKELVPGFLYQMSGRSISQLREVNIGTLSGKKIVVGLERDLPRKYSRLKGYLYIGMFTEDLPRFARILGLNPNQIISIQDVPDPGPPSRSAPRAPVTSLASNEVVVRVKRNTVESNPWIMVDRWDNFAMRMNRFLKDYDIAMGTRVLNDWNQNVSLVSLTPLQFEKMDPSGKSCFERWLEDRIDVAKLQDMIMKFAHDRIVKRELQTVLEEHLGKTFKDSSKNSWDRAELKMFALMVRLVYNGDSLMILGDTVYDALMRLSNECKLVQNYITSQQKVIDKQKADLVRGGMHVLSQYPIFTSRNINELGSHLKAALDCSKGKTQKDGN